MLTHGILAHLTAKPGKAADLEAFLKSGLTLAQDEPLTVVWFAVSLGDDRYAIFDAFESEAGRQAHLDGRIAAALMAHADELLAEPPVIAKVDVLAAKLPPAAR